jgi:CubicO group peptidase (beta-lactamase class C family)/dienelactone hydrolase
MENSRIPGAAFWTFVSLGVFLFSATSRTSAMEALPPASALSREELDPVLERVQQRGGAETPSADQESPGSEVGGIPAWRRRRGGDADAASGDGPHAVAVIEDLIHRDDARGKDLALRITYPEAGGWFPLILFSHCAGGKRDDFRPLAAQWASHGYVVVQVDHARVGNAADNWQHRVTDLKLVLDSLAEIGRQAPSLASRMDANRVGAAGHLIGAYASCALVGMKGERFEPGSEGADFSDPRIDAALLLSPQGRGEGLTETSWEDIRAPMFVVAGSDAPSTRTSNPPEWRTEPYRFAKPGDKYLLWIEGMDNSYAGLWRGGVDPQPAAFIREVTTAFWDAHLKEDAKAGERLRAWPVPDQDKARFRLESKHAASSPATAPATKAAPDPIRVHGELAADYSSKNGGRAVLVMVDGRIAFGAETATHLHSATKGFWGPVVAAMIEDGLVGSFDELVSKTLPEWEDHPRKSQITLRHLLSLNAGLVQDVENLQGDDRPTLAPDLYKHAIGVQTLREPGAVFQYGPSCYYVLGEIMKRKLAARKQSPLDYLKQRILDPIGVKVGDWVHDASGNPHIPNGAHLTARNWAEYGQWLLQRGEWNGKQIVREDLLEELIKPSKANPGHGLTLWLNQTGGQGAVGVAAQKSELGDTAGWIYRGGHSDLFAALGAGKCRMYVIPSFKMVVVRQADSQRDRFDDNTFLSLLLTRESPDIAPRRPSGSEQSVDRIFRQMDRNGDGKIAPMEAGPQLRRWFDRLDKDGDGTLGAPELRPILERRSGNR